MQSFTSRYKWDEKLSLLGFLDRPLVGVARDIKNFVVVLPFRLLEQPTCFLKAFMNLGDRSKQNVASAIWTNKIPRGYCAHWLRTLFQKPSPRHPTPLP